MLQMHEKYIEYPQVGKIYDHYKGGKYEIISMATHTETGETMVVYRSVLFGSVYVRPLSMWFEKVTINYEDGSTRQVKRFC